MISLRGDNTPIVVWIRNVDLDLNLGAQVYAYSLAKLCPSDKTFFLLPEWSTDQRIDKMTNFKYEKHPFRFDYVKKMAAPCAKGSKPSTLTLFSKFRKNFENSVASGSKGNGTTSSLLSDSDNVFEPVTIFKRKLCINCASLNLGVNINIANRRTMSVASPNPVLGTDVLLNGLLLPTCGYIGCQKKFSTQTGKRSTTHYYDVLGLSPRATQSQIKSAYYKMSKLHHPDVTTDVKSHGLFTEINEAYEVLGNLRRRRMYDRGVYNPRDRRADSDGHDKEHAANPFYQRSSNFERGSRPKPPRGRSNIYNFDEFYRQHYNDMRERRADEYKEFIRHRKILESRAQANINLKAFWTMWVILGIATIILTRSSDWDNDRVGLKGRKTTSHKDNPLSSITADQD